MLRFNKRGSLGTDSLTGPPPPSPPALQHSRFVLPTAGHRGRDNAAHVTQDLDTPKDPPNPTEQRKRSMSDDKTKVEDFEHSDSNSMNNFQPDDASTIKSKDGTLSRSGSVPLHPGTIKGKNKPSLQSLEKLAGLNIVTWEEFLDRPSVLCGLFEADREDFIHYNTEQVNVFFHDSRMEQPTLGSPSGDGLSWTIFIDSYNHLKTVRNWLTERVSVILLQMDRPKGSGTAACLVALNPTAKTVGTRLRNSFSKAVDAFSHQQNFCIEINLNDCVQRWCRTFLKMPCAVRGGRVVITNAEERVPCSRVDSVPFCLFCFPVWGVKKLSYKFKRQSEYEDVSLSFGADELTVCARSQTLKQYAENNNAKSVAKPAGNDQKRKVWIKKNRSPGVTHATQTSANDERANLEVEEVDSGEDKQDRRKLKRGNSKRDKERGQDSGFSSDSASPADRSEPQLSKGIPNYRPRGYVPPRPSDKTKPVSRDHQRSTKLRNVDEAPSISSSSTGSLISRGHGYPDDSPVKPVSSMSWQVLPDLDEDSDSAVTDTPTRVTSQASRSAQFANALPALHSDEEDGDYTLLNESPSQSPRPDTPYQKSVATTSLKGKRPVLMTQDAIIKEEGVGNSDRFYSGDRIQLRRNTPSTRNMPEERHVVSRFDSSVHQPKEEKNLYARENEAFVYDDSQDSSRLKNSSMKGKTSGGTKAFPYTSEYLDTIGTSNYHSAVYGLVDQTVMRGEEMKKKKNASAVGSEPPDVLFAPRVIQGDINQDKQSVSDDDVDDVEEIDSAMSDEEGTASPRETSARDTEQVTSSKLNPAVHDANVRWEITDCDHEEIPRILPGAKGAEQLRSSKELAAQSSSTEARRRGGEQNDSRRKYIALNSLRRKSKKQALQADLRKQKQPELPSIPPELIEL